MASVPYELSNPFDTFGGSMYAGCVHVLPLSVDTCEIMCSAAPPSCCPPAVVMHVHSPVLALTWQYLGQGRGCGGD
jgi:hypothetical protein